jgi:DNA repair protein RecN (Recombination protein N)
VVFCKIDLVVHSDCDVDAPTRQSMLTQLHIENFALIRKLTLNFLPSLNVLTGETGAGKSILIDSLRFVLGERMNLSRAQDKRGRTRVEVAFEIDLKNISSRDLLASFTDDEEPLIVLRRELEDGKTKCWVNGRVTTVSMLREIGSSLVDIHGQYDHQLLLDTQSHLGLIDLLAKSDSLKTEYGKFFEVYSNLQAKYDEVLLLEEDKVRELDLLKYQIDEIERSDISNFSEEALITEKMRLANSEKLHELTRTILESLDSREPSASSLFIDAQRPMKELIKFDPSLEASVQSKLGEAQESLEEVIRALKVYQEELTFDPARLDEIQDQLRTYELLKKKYGGGTDAIREFLIRSKERYDALSESETTKQEFLKQIKEIRLKLEPVAHELSEKRKHAAKMLKGHIETELRDLNIPKASFEVKFEAREDFSKKGSDHIEFMISLNPGEPPLPLQKIISGGEASRVMLAMKKALMEVDPISTLIFDEIDANIGGRLGSVTGAKLKEISKLRQVLLITHLPQIAAFSDHHIKVTKYVRDGKTEVRCDVLENDDKVRELAQMMSGKKETEISRRHAREMLEKVSVR